MRAGGIDRQKLGTVIFQDAQARKRLNKATHLPIMVSLARQLLGNWLRCKYLVVRMPSIPDMPPPLQQFPMCLLLSWLFNTHTAGHEYIP